MKKSVKRRPKRPRSSLPPLPKTISQFADRVGQFVGYWGFMELQGKIWALAFVSQKSLSAVEIAQLLGVSKASVSLAMKELIEYKVMFTDVKSNKRNLPLVPNEDLNQVITGVLKIRESRMIDQARRGLKAMVSSRESDFELNEYRLKKIETLIETAEALLRTVIAMSGN
jgi:DNA-binding transcriptional regulator GbsR (MarR family)